MNIYHRNTGLSVLVGLLLAAGGCPSDEGDDNETDASDAGTAGKGGASGKSASGTGGASGKGASGTGGASGNDAGKGGAGGDDGGAKGGGSGGDAGEGDAGTGSTDDHDTECAAWNVSLKALADDLDCNVEPDGFVDDCVEASAAVNSEGSCFPMWKAAIDCLMPFADNLECIGGTKLKPKAGVCVAENEAFKNAGCKDPSPND